MYINYEKIDLFIISIYLNFWRNKEIFLLNEKNRNIDEENLFFTQEDNKKIEDKLGKNGILFVSEGKKIIKHSTCEFSFILLILLLNSFFIFFNYNYEEILSGKISMLVNMVFVALFLSSYIAKTAVSFKNYCFTQKFLFRIGTNFDYYLER